MTSISRPNASGAAACAIRAGAPRCRGDSHNSSGRRSTSGSVPRAMVRMPLPEPWKIANTLAAAPPKMRDDGGADRVGDAGEPRRDQRMIAAEKARLEDARGHLRRADQRAGRDRLHRRGAGGLQDAREMRGHRAGDGPGGRENEGEQHHGAVDRNVRLHRCWRPPPWRPCTAGSMKKLMGRPIRICAAAQAKQVLRQPMVSRPQAVSGQPTVEAKPAISVMPVIERRARRRHRCGRARRRRRHRAHRPCRCRAAARRTTSTGTE